MRIRGAEFSVIQLLCLTLYYGCVLTKDFEPYSIVGGNPSRLIRKRKEEV